jgi:hypothetical protein
LSFCARAGKQQEGGKSYEKTGERQRGKNQDRDQNPHLDRFFCIGFLNNANRRIGNQNKQNYDGLNERRHTVLAILKQREHERDGRGAEENQR